LLLVIELSFQYHSSIVYFSINKDIDGVMAGIVSQHDHCWLYPPLKEAYSQILKAGSVNNCKIVSVELWKEVGEECEESNTQKEPKGT
jgi:hypothetical protein